jgi:hypothetical protein
LEVAHPVDPDVAYPFRNTLSIRPSHQSRPPLLMVCRILFHTTMAVLTSELPQMLHHSSYVSLGSRSIRILSSNSHSWCGFMSQMTILAGPSMA